LFPRSAAPTATTPPPLCHPDSGGRARHPLLALPLFGARSGISAIVHAGAMLLSNLLQ
jgi:hypothetical protein